ncbi:MAG: hypothetical protein WCS73_11310 [Lentisphaeria bacterium]
MMKIKTKKILIARILICLLMWGSFDISAQNLIPFDGVQEYKDISFSSPNGAAVFTVLCSVEFDFQKWKIKSSPTVYLLDMKAVGGDKCQQLSRIKLFWHVVNNDSYIAFQPAAFDQKTQKQIAPRFNILRVPFQKKEIQNLAIVAGGSELKFYLNGSDISIQRPRKYLPYSLYAPNYKMRIGATFWRKGTLFFPGKIGKVAVFGTVLSTEKIAAYQSGKEKPVLGQDAFIIQWGF